MQEQQFQFGNKYAKRRVIEPIYTALHECLKNDWYQFDTFRFSLRKKEKKMIRSKLCKIEYINRLTWSSAPLNDLLYYSECSKHLEVRKYKWWWVLSIYYLTKEHLLLFMFMLHVEYNTAIVFTQRIYMTHKCTYNILWKIFMYAWCSLFSNTSIMIFCKFVIYLNLFWLLATLNVGNTIRQLN